MPEIDIPHGPESIHPAGRHPEAAPTSGRVWKFWGTLAWALVIYAAVTAAQMIVAVLVLLWTYPGRDLNLDDVGPVFAHGVTVALAVIAVAPVVLALIAFAVRLARAKFADYLALKPFRWRDLAVGLACVAIYLPLIALAAHLGNIPIAPPFVLDTYRTARDSGALALFVFAVAVVAPVTEELAVRGFLFRGLAASRLGAAGAVVLSSAIWAAMHLQYDWFFTGEIFGAGLIFGAMRHRSGSTWLTVVLHGVYNLAAVAQAAILLRLA